MSKNNKPFIERGAVQEVLRCLFFHGPTWDGNIPSKSGRDDLDDLGLITRHNGWQWLNDEGARIAISDFGLDAEKEKWQARKRSAA